MMADVGRVAEKEGRAVRGRQGDRPIVGNVCGQPAGHVQHRRVGAQRKGGERSDLDADQLGAGEYLAGGQKESARSGARINDSPGGTTLAGGPGDHGVDDRPRGVHRTLLAPSLRGAEAAERAAERIFAPTDRSADRLQAARKQPLAVVRGSVLSRRQGCIRTCQGGSGGRKLVLGRKGRHRLVPRSCRCGYRTSGVDACRWRRPFARLRIHLHRIRPIPSRLAHGALPGNTMPRIPSGPAGDDARRQHGPECTSSTPPHPSSQGHPKPMVHRLTAPSRPSAWGGGIACFSRTETSIRIMEYLGLQIV